MGRLNSTFKLQTYNRKKILKMASRKLQHLTSSELSSELSKAGLNLKGKNVDDKERFLRLSTYLIDRGEDPISYEFKSENFDSKIHTVDKRVQTERLELLQKVVKFEKSYF